MASNLMTLLKLAATNASANHGILIYEAGITNSPTTLTYTDLLALVEQSCGKLQKYNFENKEVVVLYFQDLLQSIKWFWTVVATGAVPCILPSLTKDSEQRKKQLQRLQSLLDHPLFLIQESLLPDLDGVRNLNIATGEQIDLVELDQAPLELHEVPGLEKKPDDLAALMLTSGSTGNAKAVCLQHGQLIASVRGKIQSHKTEKNDVFLNWSGFDHVAGLVEIHLQALYLSALQVHLPQTSFLTEPIQFLQIVNEHRISYTFSPGSFFMRLIRSLEVENKRARLPLEDASDDVITDNVGVKTVVGDSMALKLDLSCLRAMISGGEANIVETCEKLTTVLQAYNARPSFIRPGFGMTETCAGSIYNALDCPGYDISKQYELANVGMPIEGVLVRIMKDSGIEAARNESGSLQLSGLAIFTRYYNDHKATQEAFTQDGWFKTGDVGVLDDNNRLRVIAREKDTIIINGANHFPQAIEASLDDARIPGVVPSYFAIFPHRPKGSDSETLCVVYLPSYNVDDVESRVGTALAISRVIVTFSGVRPYVIIPLEASLLVKSSLGKLSRPKIRKAFEDGEYAKYQEMDEMIVSQYKNSIYESAATETEKLILRAYKDILGSNVGYVGINDDLYSIGFSSVDILTLRVYLQRDLGVDVPITIFFSHPVIKDLAQALDDLQHQKYDPVVILQHRGHKTPIFFIHPGMGEILIFLNFARYFEDRPVYALRARGFDGEQTFTSMTELADTYHAAIKRAQPQGPYIIAGYSFGSIAGFEIAKIMEATGDKVAMLATFDQAPYFKQRARAYDWYEIALSLAYFLDLVPEDHALLLKKDPSRSILPEMRTKTREEVIHHLLSIGPPARIAELGLNARRMMSWVKVAMDLKIITYDYEPTGLVSNMDVFYTEPLYGIVAATSKEEWFNDYISKWSNHVDTEVRYHFVDGTHRNMIMPPQLATFQKKFKAALEARGL